VPSALHIGDAPPVRLAALRAPIDASVTKWLTKYWKFLFERKKLTWKIWKDGACIGGRWGLIGFERERLLWAG
jgi:hypothetical protein